MLVKLSQYCKEIGAFYNCFSKCTFIPYSSKFNKVLISHVLSIFLYLAFYIVIFVKALKNCTGSILKASIIFLNLLISYCLLTQLWIYSHHISLSADIKLDPGLKQDINQFLSVHLNLNRVTSNKLPKFSL